MKTRRWVSVLILLFSVLMIIGSCATRKKAITDEELSKAYTGTWINEEHERTTNKRAMIVLFADGTWERYTSLKGGYHTKGENVILDKWKDSKGNIWFTADWENFTHHTKGNTMIKISESGNTLEELSTLLIQNKVEEWEPDNPHYLYRIYYRQE